MEIKFTSDNKKVIVIGSLNSTEKIVQEIFIVNGSEIPSGEHFVVKSLHDTPVLSWKEKELKKIEIKYEALKFKYDNELKVLNARYETISVELKNKIEYAGKVLKNVSPESFNNLTDYLTGKIRYIVKSGYSPELIEWKDFIQTYEGRLRLISIYGKDDGGLIYAVGDYYDFSGSHRNFRPFNNYEDAFSYFTSQILNCTISDTVIEVAKKYNIQLDKEKIKQFNIKKYNDLTKNINHYQEAINTWTDSINKISIDDKY